MNSVEDRVRAATRAQADLLREVRPLQLVPEPDGGRVLGPAARLRRARRMRIWVAPLAAAAAIIVLATVTLLIRHSPNAPVVSASPTAIPTTPASADSVPEYYMALPGGDNFVNDPGATTAVLGDTFSGKQLLTVRPSGDDKFVSVLAAADDRTFVLGGEPNPQPPAPPTASDWYVVHVSLAPTPTATIRKLAITLPAGFQPDSTALSPDGSELAMSSEVPAQVRAGGAWAFLIQLRLYSVATGALLGSWSGTVPGGPAAVVEDNGLSWTADGKRIAFDYSYNAASNGDFGTRLLAIDLPGHDLMANSQPVWSGCDGTVGSTEAVTPDGQTVICDADLAPGTGVAPSSRTTVSPTACAPGPSSKDAAFTEYSAASGKLLRTFYSEFPTCTLGGQASILWTSTTGDKVIGTVTFPSQPTNQQAVSSVQFGVYSAGTFTPLPTPPTTTATAIAW